MANNRAVGTVVVDVLPVRHGLGHPQPMRIVFARSQQAKERLEPCLAEANRPKMMGSPVTAILAYDMQFYKQLPYVFPSLPQTGSYRLLHRLGRHVVRQFPS